MDYTLSEDTAERLTRMLRWFEKLIGPDTGGGGHLSGLGNWQFVRVTGAGVVDTEGEGETYYPGQVTLRSEPDASWVDTSGTCWVKPAENKALTSGSYYACRQTGNKTLSSSTRPCFVAAGVSADIQMCRVWAASVASNGINYYPAKFNQMTSGDAWQEGPLIGTTYDCWLVQRFNYSLTVGSGSGGGCYTGIRQPGTRTLSSSGTSYTLPVYATTDFPAMGEDCVILN